MKLTRATAYAVIALAYLARENADVPVASGAIARAGGIPDLFLLKVLLRLVQARLVRSRRGPGGGYTLARDPKDITLLEIVEAVEGPLRGMADPVSREGAALDKRLQSVCAAAASQVRELLATVTLAELAKVR
jgi:Rrf2 family protein